MKDLCFGSVARTSMSCTSARIELVGRPSKNRLPRNRESTGSTERHLVGLQVGSGDGLREGLLVGLQVVVGEKDMEGAGTGVGATLLAIGECVGDTKDRTVGCPDGWQGTEWTLGRADG